MADRMTITVDHAALLKAMTDLGPAALRFTKAAAKVTADNIKREAQGRVARATGATGDAITVDETHNGDGYVVFVGNNRTHIGRFLEFGTKYMPARPFLFASATLEAGPHDRRMAEAVQDAIDDVGLGG
jgi:HK97 gp10 family phage protein